MRDDKWQDPNNVVFLVILDLNMEVRCFAHTLLLCEGETI